MGAPTFTQKMVIDAVDGLVERGIPTSLYVIDYFNWAKMGDYTFNPKMWPGACARACDAATVSLRQLRPPARASARVCMMSVSLFVVSVGNGCIERRATDHA